MKEYHTEIVIHRPPEEVWDKLTDFDAYPGWNPLVGSLEGDFRTGGEIEMYIKPLGKTFKAKLRRVERPEEMTWIGVQGAEWILAGEHYYRLERLGDGSTRLLHGEYFRGLLSLFLGKATLRQMEETFEEHNRLLKDQVEHA